jgi:hypothetical protein
MAKFFTEGEGLAKKRRERRMQIFNREGTTMDANWVGGAGVIFAGGAVVMWSGFVI